MLTKDELDFLNKIPTDKVVHIYPFDSSITRVANELVSSIKKVNPDLKVKHMGSSALKISGQNDIDIYSFSDPSDFDKFLPGLIKLFGEPLYKHETFCEWKFGKEGFDIEFYLTAKDSVTMQKQIRVFETLKNNLALLKEYENLKASMNGRSFREYQEKKYEFYHLISSSNNIDEALNFLIKSINTTGHNPKPVIFHSIKVAMLLLGLSYGEDIVVAALLHDLIEDSQTSYEDIKQKFGQKVADIVQALTFDISIKDRDERDKEEADKAINFGRDAVVIKAADFIDNSHYYYLADKTLQPHLAEKYKYFLDKSMPIIGTEEIYEGLAEGYRGIGVRLNGFVRESYNRIANDYSETRDQFKNFRYLEKINSLLNPNSVILDLGCGAGVPIDKYFVEKDHKVIGLDISPKQIELAKKNVPEASFFVKDMSDLKPKEFGADAVVSFYAIFHTPREKHLEILKKINSFLTPNGLILITMGASEWEGIEDFHGTKMFWSHFGPEKNIELVTKAGFEIIFNEIDSSGGEKHLIILARKK